MEEGRADLVAGIAGLEEEELAELGLAQGDLDALLGPAPAAPWPWELVGRSCMRARLKKRPSHRSVSILATGGKM